MKKNILVIMADQLRKDCIGAYGNNKVKTPNIDRLASISVQFNRNYVANPICSPNRHSIFSGMYPSNHGVWTNGLVKEDKEQTIMHLVKQTGYETASIGKIHFNPYSQESAGKSLECVESWHETDCDTAYSKGYFGFDHVELTLGHTLNKSHYSKWFKENGGTEDMFECRLFEPDTMDDEPCGIRALPSRLSSSAFVGDRGVNYLKNIRDKNKPFFLSVSFPDPHHPFTSCEDTYTKWDGKEVQEPIGDFTDLRTRPSHFTRHFHGGWTRGGDIPFKHEGGISREIERERIRHTYAMIEDIDKNIGLLLDEMEEQDILKDTIIVFTSDHGELLGDHGLWLKGPFLYEGLINTPLLIHHPDIAARKSDTLFSAVDLVPTMCDMIGIPIPCYTDGLSQWEHLHDYHKQVRENCLVEYRNGYSEDTNVWALVSHSYKFIQYETGDCEYTDLENDPHEKVNYACDPLYITKLGQATRQLLIERLKAKVKGTPQYGHA